MKVFFDHRIFCKQTRGGPSRYFVKLSEKLNLMNINAKIFAPLHFNEFLNEKKFKNNTGFARKIFFSNYLVNTRISPKLSYVNEKVNFFLYKKFNPQIIHTTYYNGNNDYYDKPLVVTVFDLIHEIFFKDYGYKNPIYPKKKILNRADHIICISQSTANDLINFYNVDKKKISVIYLGVEKKILNIKNLKIKSPYILYVGARQKYKNFTIFLKTLSLDSKILKNFDVVLFGGEKPKKNEIDLISSLKLNHKKFHFITGDDETLYSYYQNARAFIFPSKYEGFGLPILESFTNKCPVICTRIKPFIEIAENAAVYFEPNDVLSMLEALNKVLFSENLRKNLISEGSLRLEKFDWFKCANETKEIYKKLL